MTTSKPAAPSSQPRHTPLYQSHVDAGGKLVDFSGWQMPVNYGSQIKEHLAVRTHAGMFDVSHMTIVDIEGSGSRAFLQRLLANDIDKASTPGKAIYSCMLNKQAGIVDDLIAYYIKPESYRLVVNAGTRDKDLAWMVQQADDTVSITEQPALAMIAVQGPQARAILHNVLPAGLGDSMQALGRFSACQSDGWFVARTGYTGEDGCEIALPDTHAAGFWQQLLDAGVTPCGLGARDTLRLEAGMNLYGSDMTDNTTPLECGIAWTVAWSPESRDFIGREALVAQRDKADHRLMKGLVLEGRGVLRGHQRVLLGDTGIGEVTSGTFSPTLEKSIAFARLDASARGRCDVLIRDKRVPAQVVTLPFVKNGEAAYEESN